MGQVNVRWRIADHPVIPVATVLALLSGYRILRHPLVASHSAHPLLRPNAFMQNYLGQAATIRAQGRFYLAQGNAAITVVDTHDIAAVAVRALTEPGHLGRTYTITGREAITNSEVADKLSVALGRKINYLNVTDEQAADSMRAAGMTEFAVRATTEFMQVARAGHLAVVVEDVESVLGRRPTSFDQFLNDHLEAFGGALSQSSTR
jgi:uncharacterized protein YbjT (DUF2867 family)